MTPELLGGIVTAIAGSSALTAWITSRQTAKAMQPKVAAEAASLLVSGYESLLGSQQREIDDLRKEILVERDKRAARESAFDVLRLQVEQLVEDNLALRRQLEAEKRITRAQDEKIARLEARIKELEGRTNGA